MNLRISESTHLHDSLAQNNKKAAQILGILSEQGKLN